MCVIDFVLMNMNSDFIILWINIVPLYLHDYR